MASSPPPPRATSRASVWSSYTSPDGVSDASSASPGPDQPKWLRKASHVHGWSMSTVAGLRGVADADTASDDSDGEDDGAALLRSTPAAAGPSARRRRRRRWGCCPRCAWPPRTLHMLYMVVAVNSIALSAPSAFMPRFAEKRFGEDEDSVGPSVGALVACFSFGMFLSSFYTGHLSDVYGRKPLLLLGVTVCCTMLLLFGFSPTFGWAAANRVTEGLLNGVIPVVKAYMTDITRPGTERQLAFAYFGATFSAARAISAATTGFVYDLAPRDTWLEFTLPCFVAAVPQVITLVLVWRYLPANPKPVAGTPPPTGSGAAVELAPLTRSRASGGADAEAGGATGAAAAPASTTAPAGSTAGRKPGLWDGIQHIMRDRDVLLLVALYGLNSFCNGSVLVAFVLFLTLPVHDRGMGQSPGAVGAGLFVLGATSLLFQVKYFKRLIGKLGALGVYQTVGVPTLGFGILIMPIASLPLQYWCVADTATGDVQCEPPVLAWVAAWLGFGLATLGVAVGFMTLLPNVHLMLSNVGRTSQRGLTQGVAQSFAALLRGVGPFISGVLFAKFAHQGDPFWLFAVLGAMYGVSRVVSCGLDPARVQSNA